MDDDGQRDVPDDAALVERVRQAELHLSAQVTFLAAAYQRGAVLVGVLFVIVAALVGASLSFAPDTVGRNALGMMALALTLGLILTASSTVLAGISLPGSVDNLDSAASKTELLKDLLGDYDIAARQNRRRLAFSRSLMFANFLCMMAALVCAAMEIREHWDHLRFESVVHPPPQPLVVTAAPGDTAVTAPGDADNAAKAKE
jgi:hypothetical protein